MKMTINCDTTIGPLSHFWQSTGFTPANLLLDADMQQAMTWAGALPHAGIRYVRVHYLLELVTAEGLDTPSPTYNWAPLDEALDALVHNGLLPFFELMGNVSGFFNDYTEPVQSRAWKRLVRDLAQHLIARYGAEEIRSWLFETWNEPDIGFWKQSIEAFLIYYDACAEGLQEADPALRMGGPGTCQRLSDTLKAFLAHCDTGTSYFTGGPVVQPVFISVHEKGVRSHKEDITPDSMDIITRERRIITYIREHHPRLAELPFVNDECDPQVGWGTIHTWRARPYYPALAAKIINQHLVALADDMGCTYGLLSNDNGFLGTWGHRTLFARISDFDHIDHGQADGHRDAPRLEEDPRRRRFALIKKPIFNLMGLLSLLGDRRCAVEGVGSVEDDVGVIATRHDADQIVILIYNSRDRIMSSGVTPITLQLDALPFRHAMLAHYRIDADHGDPFLAWEAMGAPAIPSPQQLADLRAHQELALLDIPREVSTEDGTFTLTFDLPLPGVSLVLLSAKPAEGPGKVRDLRAARYEGLTGHPPELLLTWQGGDSRCLRTYEVLYAPTPDAPFVRINGPDQLDRAFLYAADTIAGAYKVRAVDYWGRVGEASEPIVV